MKCIRDIWPVCGIIPFCVLYYRGVSWCGLFDPLRAAFLESWPCSCGVVPGPRIDAPEMKFIFENVFTDWFNSAVVSIGDLTSASFIFLTTTYPAFRSRVKCVQYIIIKLTIILQQLILLKINNHCYNLILISYTSNNTANPVSAPP